MTIFRFFSKPSKTELQKSESISSVQGRKKRGPRSSGMDESHFPHAAIRGFPSLSLDSRSTIFRYVWYGCLVMSLIVQSANHFRTSGVFGMALRTCGRVNAANQISIIAGTSSTVACSRVSCDGAILSGMLMPVRYNVFAGLVF